MASEQMENLKAVMKQMITAGLAPKFDETVDPFKLREVVHAAQLRMPRMPGVEFTAVDYNGVEGEKCTKADMRNDYIVFYIHGGGLICGDAFSSRGFASTLVTETGCEVFTVSYRLAPENDIRAIYTDTFEFYKGIVDENPDTPVFLIGESGGAYLCYAVAMLARDNDVKIPAGIAPFSAPIDFCGRIDRNFEGNEDFTVNPAGMEMLAGILDPKGIYTEDIYAHPYLDDMKGLPPMLLAWDQNESLAVDQDIVVEKVKAVGGEITYRSYPHCFHAFATSGRGTPEASEILDDTLAFFEAHK